MSTKTILLVEDDVDIRDSLCDFFQDEGYRVVQATNGNEAVEYLRANPSTSLVLLDLMMPIMNGYQFRAEQKEDPALAPIPVLVMTARGSVDPNEFDVEVLHKPLKLAKLLDAVHRVERAA